MTAPQQPGSGSTSTTSPAKKKQRNISIGQVLAGVLLVLIVVFVVENTRTVPIRFIAGPEVKVPVYLAILIAAVVGALVAALMRFRRQHKK